jgi:hypothetical protein
VETDIPQNGVNTARQERLRRQTLTTDGELVRVVRRTASSAFDFNGRIVLAPQVRRHRQLPRPGVPVLYKTASSSIDANPAPGSARSSCAFDRKTGKTIWETPRSETVAGHRRS